MTKKLGECQKREFAGTKGEDSFADWSWADLRGSKDESKGNQNVVIGR